MRLRNFAWFEPGTVDEALALLDSHPGKSRLMAGGTDLLPAMKLGTARPQVVISLGAVAGLAGLRFDAEKGLEIGPLTRLRTLETDAMITQKYPLVAEAAHAVGSWQLRQMGTIGGNLALEPRCIYYNQSAFWRLSRPRCLKMGGDRCNAAGGGRKCYAAYCGDMAVALIALGAEATVASSAGLRTFPLEQLYTGNGASPLSLLPGEILVAVRVAPPHDNSYGKYLKYRVRDSIDFPLVNCAAHVTLGGDGRVTEGRVVIGAVSPRPQVISGVREALIASTGDRLGDVVEQVGATVVKKARPVENQPGVSARHRKTVAGVLTRRALTDTLRAAALID